jgi:branched-chain amino acid aminotransferase
MAYGKTDKTGGEAGLDASALQYSWTSCPKPTETTGQDSYNASTDHMIQAIWTAGEGWQAPQLVPYADLALAPTTSVLHYATSCFEGLKLYRGDDGRLRLLRPEYNCERMAKSAAALALPTFDPAELLALIVRLCAVEAPKWLPRTEPRSCLYVRPLLMGCDASIGVRLPRSAMLCIMMIAWRAGPARAVTAGQRTPVGSRLLASDPNRGVRAFPGGTGAAKVGANYAPTLVQQRRALEAGYDQVLWLFGLDGQVTEASGANVFFILTTASSSPGDQAEMEMVTPPLDDDGLILAGNTRAIVLELARSMFATDRGNARRCKVSERRITSAELVRAGAEGRLQGAFVTGTAWQIHPVAAIGGLVGVDGGGDLDVPVAKISYVEILQSRLDAIVYGREEAGHFIKVVEEDNGVGAV